MHAHSSQGEAAERLQIEYTAKPVSGWGGLMAFVRYWDLWSARISLCQNCVKTIGRDR
jgi:hypothetical protein